MAARPHINAHNFLNTIDRSVVLVSNYRLLGMKNLMVPTFVVLNPRCPTKWPPDRSVDILKVTVVVKNWTLKFETRTPGLRLWCV